MDAEIDEGYVSEGPRSPDPINFFHSNQGDEGFFEENQTEEYFFDDEFEWDDEQLILV